MAMCPYCGAALVPPYRFCPQCGRAVPEALPYPPPVYYVPPKQTNWALIIVAVILVLIVVPFILSAVLYFMVSGLIGGPAPLPPMAAFVSKSSNGSYWIVTFTSVQPGMTSSGTDLGMSTSASLAAVSPTPLSALPGGNVTLDNSLGTLYIAYQGAVAGIVRAGDTILIAASTSRGASTTGYHLQLTWDGSAFTTSLA